MTGATGYVGGRLVPKLLDDGHAVRAMARNPDKLDDVPWRDRRRGGPRRPRRPRFPDRGVRRHGCRLLPGALDGHVSRLRRRGSRFGAQRRRRGAAGGRETAGLSGRAAPAGSRPVAASAVADRGRRHPDQLRHRDRRPAGRDRGRLGLGVVRDDAAHHQPAAGDDDPEVGAQQDPADRDRRRAALSGRAATAAVPTSRTWDIGGPDVARVRRRDAGLCRSGGPAPAAHRRDSLPDTDDREPVDRTRHPDAHRASPGR